jgi:hypothetical protein
MLYCQKIRPTCGIGASGGLPIIRVTFSGLKFLNALLSILMTMPLLEPDPVRQANNGKRIGKRMAFEEGK